MPARARNRHRSAPQELLDLIHETVDVAGKGESIGAGKLDELRFGDKGRDLPAQVGHGDRFGPLGNASLILALAAPVLAAPFLWGAPTALLVILSVAFGMLSLALYRASVLPCQAIVAFGMAAPAGILIALAGILRDLLDAGLDTSNFLPLGLAPFAVGLIWIGWSTWLEPEPQRLVPPGGVSLA